MASKSKYQIKAKDCFDNDKSTLYEATKGSFPMSLFEEDRLFAILLLCGYPRAKAYRLAYPESSASSASSAVLGSRKSDEPIIQRFIGGILNQCEAGLLVLSPDCYKEESQRKKFRSPQRKK